MAYNLERDDVARRPRVRFARLPEQRPPPVVRSNSADAPRRSHFGPVDAYQREQRPVQVQVHGRPLDGQGVRPAVYRELARPEPPYASRMVASARRAEPEPVHRRRQASRIAYTDSIPMMAPTPRMPARSYCRSEGAPVSYNDTGVTPQVFPEHRLEPSPPPQARAMSVEEPESRFMAAATYDVEDPFATPGSPKEPATVEDTSDLGFAHLRPPSPMGDDVDVLDAFEFVLPQAEPLKQTDLADLLEAAGAESESSPRDDASTIRPSDATSAFSSTYTGDTELGGVHSASITVLHDPKGRKRPLFQWLHIQQDMMNFDEFWAEIPRQVRLSEAEVTATAKLRADVKRHSLKARQNPKGSYVGYMDPRHFQVPLKNGDAKRATNEGPGPAARWICLPYFALQEYTGLLSASSTSSFPPLTLLQSHYSRTPEQRDMQQAVCQLHAAPRGECFHIAQLWCLVLDNSLLVTCGTMTQADLYGDSLKLISQPAMAQSELRPNGRILVSYGSAVTWIFTVQECPTWFSFSSRFTAFWPNNLEFTWRDQVVSPSSWPKILKYASRPQGKLTLRLRILPIPSAPESVLKTDGLDEAVAQGSPSGAERPPGFLHVLMLRPADWPQDADTDPDEVAKKLNKQLQAAEDFILGRTSFAQQRAYKSCGGATRLQVHEYLAQQEAQVEEKASDSVRRLYEERIDVYNAAEILFRLFFPKDFDGPTTSQYWGSVKSVVHMASLDEGHGEDFLVHPEITRELRTYLQLMAQTVQAFQRVVAYAGEKERAEMEMPRQFVTAWLHIVSGLIATTATAGQDSWLSYMGKTQMLLEEGMQNIIQGLADRSLVDDLAVLPMEIMSLIAMDLLQDRVGKSDDIVDTYSNYLSSLDTDITSKPSDRSYQHSVELVQQEMTAVKKTLARQRYILGCIRANLSGISVSGGAEYVDAGDDLFGYRRGRREGTPGRYYPPPYREATPAPGYYSSYQPMTRTVEYADMTAGDELVVGDLEAASKLSPTDANGLRGLLLAECARSVEQREFEFRRHTDYAEDLERAVAFKMGWTKDRQENAIYAFTIVTIVFLPISAISSIFGMNTNDVRNMAYNQWLYWAVTVPVTLVVIVLGLWWMGELGNVLGWFVGRRPDRAAAVTQRRPTSLAAAASMMPQMRSAAYGREQMVDAEVESVPMAYTAEDRDVSMARPRRRYSEEPPPPPPPMVAASRLRRRPQSVYT